MQRANHVRLLETLRTGRAEMTPPFAIPADRYRDPAQLRRELAVLASPRIALASSALGRGACATIDGIGPPTLIVRDGAGTVRAFANSCRHRAARLVETSCAAKAFVCPYHGWTYDLAGALVHLPHAEGFAGCEHRDLRALPVAERHGLIWLGGGDAAVETFVGALAPDLDALDVGAMVPWRSSRVTRQCNWKLVIEAFLDGYHLRVLHRDTIYRYFIDVGSLAEPVGPHIRAVSARRALRDAAAVLPGADLYALGTPSFVVFPATVVIGHPDFLSILTMTPLAPDRTIVDHAMLVPAARRDETEHWDKSWNMIDSGVIQREDLWACEQIQRGLDDELLFGSFEQPVRWFHDALAAAGA